MLIGRRIAIGDIHGCINTFRILLFDKLKIKKQDEIYLLGDLIDRGPDSKSVIDLIIELNADGYNLKPIVGNHEYMLINSFNSYESYANWINNNAGGTTLKSFGVVHPMYFEQKYIDFFKNLKYFYLLDEYVIVHGGLNFESDKPFKDKFSMVWIRNKTIDMVKTGGRKLIVGHTPSKLSDIIASVSSNKILLDGGCVYKKISDKYGYLVGYNLDTKVLYYVENSEL